MVSTESFEIPRCQENSHGNVFRGMSNIFLKMVRIETFYVVISILIWMMGMTKGTLVARVVCPKDENLRSMVLKQAEDDDIRFECAG